MAPAAPASRNVLRVKPPGSRFPRISCTLFCFQDDATAWRPPSIDLELTDSPRIGDAVPLCVIDAEKGQLPQGLVVLHPFGDRWDTQHPPDLGDRIDHGAVEGIADERSPHRKPIMRLCPQDRIIRALDDL